MVSHMSTRPNGHDRTIRWLAYHNFVKVVLMGRWPAQTDHLQHARLVRPRRSAWPRHKMWLMVQTHVEWFTRRTPEQWPTQPGQGKQHTAVGLNMGHGLQHMCTDVAPQGLTHRCQPTAARILPYMLERVADCYGTIRWPLRHNFSKVVLTDHQQA